MQANFVLFKNNQDDDFLPYKDIYFRIMNGFVAIYNKCNTFSGDISCLLDKGLDLLSHRGAKSRNTFLMNRKLQKVRPTDEQACLAMGITRFAEVSGVYSSGCNNSPIASDDENILFFEGRLLNKEELCQALIPTGTTNLSDSEVVLRLFKQSGTGCLSSIKGFWSLICLDIKSKTLYAARDHFGNRQMWFCNTGNQFALASEYRTLYSLFEDARSINRNTVVDYLLWGNIGLQDQYFFKDIHSIEPSHFVKYEIESNRFVVERYYTLPYDRSKTTYNEVNEKRFLDQLLAILISSLQKNLSQFDGTLAVGVSGGMDSSTLLCLSKKIDPERKFVAFTTTDNYDGGEIYWAEKGVRHTGVEWIKVMCTADHIMEQLEAINRVHSTPVYNPSSLTQFRLIEEMKKQGQTVFFDGQGGDEMLGGHPAYYPLFLQSLRKNGEWKRWWMELRHLDNVGMTRKEIIMRRLKLWAKAHYYTPQKLAQNKLRFQYESLMSEIRDPYFAHPSPVPTIEKEVLNDALFESYTIFLSNILRWGEQSAASQGVECVMPFSDYPDLTEFAFSIPSSYKINLGWNKCLLRRAMAGIVPDEICARKQKMGFYFPEQKWLNDLQKPISDALLHLRDPEECIQMSYVLKNLNQLFTCKNPLYQQFIFRCYSYLLWRNNL